MKRLLLLLALMGIVAVGCSKEEIDKGDENAIPENIFFGIDKENVTISPDGGSVDVVVYSNYKWEISGTSDWCTPSVTTGDANEDGQKVTFTADVTYDDREATFWFHCADEKIKLVVSQKLKAVIIPDANNSFNIPAEGGVAVISYKTSVDCEVIIPEEAQDWITIVPATRGLVSENINLDIAENKTYDPRSAVIKVVAKDNAELVVEYTINQEQNDAILADGNNTFTVPSIGGEVAIKYQTNVDCEVIIPKEAQDWITIAPVTRGLVSESISLDVAKNTTCDSRSAVIKVVAKDNADLVVEYTINQERNDAILEDGNNTFTVPSIGGEVEIKYQTNVDCEVIIPKEAQDWITIAPVTRGLVSESISLDVAENTTCDSRSAVIKVIAKDNADLVIEYIITQNPKYCIYYTSSNGKIVTPYSSMAFDATILSNTYEDGVGVIEFNAPITEIGDWAFRGCSSLTSITIPDSVTSIGDYAFYSCNLTSLTIGNGVTSIGKYAFQNCSSLTSATIGNSVITIGDRAFSDCSSLTSLTIGDSVTSIGYGAFIRCHNLTNLTIPDSVTTIGDAAFNDCSSLTSLTIPGSVTTIGISAFSKCVSLTSVTIPDSVTAIGELAFACCLSLTSVTIPDSITSMGYNPFYSSSSLQEFNGKFASEDGRCLIIEGILNSFAPAGLTEYSIPDSVITIGEWAFSGCSSLTNVTIPDSVTTIGDYAFYSCDELISVTIGDSVTSIGNDAFNYCHNLTSVYCKPTTPSVASIENGSWKAFDNNTSDRMIYVPMESVSNYKSAGYFWSTYADAIVGYNF